MKRSQISSVEASFVLGILLRGYCIYFFKKTYFRIRILQDSLVLNMVSSYIFVDPSIFSKEYRKRTGTRCTGKDLFRSESSSHQSFTSLE